MAAKIQKAIRAKSVKVPSSNAKAPAKDAVKAIKTASSVKSKTPVKTARASSPKKVAAAQTQKGSSEKLKEALNVKSYKKTAETTAQNVKVSAQKKISEASAKLAKATATARSVVNEAEKIAETVMKKVAKKAVAAVKEEIHSVTDAISARKESSSKKQKEKNELESVVAKLKSMGAPKSTAEKSGTKSKASAQAELTARAAADIQGFEAKVVIAAPGEVVPPPTKSERQKIERVLNDSSQPPAKKWQNLFEFLKNMRAKAYLMSETYQAKTPIHHKVLGWGYVIDSRENRIEVLFKEGIKTLITNYRS